MKDNRNCNKENGENPKKAEKAAQKSLDLTSKYFNGINSEMMKALNKSALNSSINMSKALGLLNKQVVGINSEMMKALNKSVLNSGINMSKALGSLNKQVVGINSEMMKALNKSVLNSGINMSKALGSLNKQVVGINSEMMKALNKSVLNSGINMSKALGSLNKQVVGINSEMMKALNKSALNSSINMSKALGSLNKHLVGISPEMMKVLNKSVVDNIKEFTKLQNVLENSTENINFNCIKINENGSINYLNQTVDITNNIEEINSYFSQDKFAKGKHEQDTKYWEKLKFTINILMFIFFLGLILNIRIEFNSASINNDLLKDEVVEDTKDLKKDIEYGLDEIIKIFLFMYSLLIRVIISADNFALKHPAFYPILYDIGKCILKKLYNFAKQQKENITCSCEFLNDRKRKVKLIKRYINNSIKNKYDNKIINEFFYNNLGLVNYKFLAVRSNNNLKAPIIYKLSLGEIIIILKKNKKWTYVQFEGKDNYNYMGWVLTRYISKFN